MVIMYIISIRNCAKSKQVYADINIFTFFNGIPVQHCIHFYQFSLYKIFKSDCRRKRNENYILKMTSRVKEQYSLGCFLYWRNLLNVLQLFGNYQSVCVCVCVCIYRENRMKAFNHHKHFKNETGILASKNIYCHFSCMIMKLECLYFLFSSKMEQSGDYILEAKTPSYQ